MNAQNKRFQVVLDRIKLTEIPENWGLLWVDDSGKITPVKYPERQESNFNYEMKIISSILRRIDIKPQIFSFKNHKK